MLNGLKTKDIKNKLFSSSHEANLSVFLNITSVFKYNVISSYATYAENVTDFLSLL